jgi:uncharacterized membrane protein YkgB
MHLPARMFMKRKSGGCRCLRLLRAAMILIFFFLGCQEWINYETLAAIPFMARTSLIAWFYPPFGVLASWLSGLTEWVIGLLLLLGFRHDRIGFVGALGACIVFAATVTMIPFRPDAWAGSAADPGATDIPFLIENLTLLAASLLLLWKNAQSQLSAESASREFAGDGKAGALQIEEGPVR